MTGPEPEKPHRFQNLTGAGWGAFLIAIFSVIAAGIVLGKPDPSIPREAPPLVWLFPYLLIVALMATGFRRSGDVVAFLVGLSGFLLYGLLGLLSGMGGTGLQKPDQGLFTFVFMQLAMALFAGTDLFNNWKLPNQPIPLLRRALGLFVPVVAYLVSSSVTKGAVNKEEQRFASEARTQRVNAEIQTAAWMYRSALGDVLRLAQCVERFRGDSIAGPAPKSLRSLNKWAIDTNLERNNCGSRLFERHTDITQLPSERPPLDTVPHPDWGDVHHVVYYEPPTHLRGDPFQRARFTLGIESVWDSTQFPNAVGQPGKRNYLLDPDGNIHVTAERRRATVSDPIVPVCAGDQRSTNDLECRRPFQSRQRWGLVDRVPSFSIHVHSESRNVLLPDSARATLSFRQVNALDSIRAVFIDWGDGRKPTVVNLVPSRSISPYFDLDAHHAYAVADTGEKIIHARLVTRAGPEYKDEVTVFISAPDRR